MTEPKTILVVDDDPNVLELVRVNCASQGYYVQTAANGIEALQIIEKSLPELIVLDILMPQMDGWEVCRLVREKYQESTKVIMLMTEDEERIKFIVKSILMADEYLVKPFDISKLLAMITRLLSEAAA
jgi:DNA-binding response OmpR family regulator